LYKPIRNRITLVKNLSNPDLSGLKEMGSLECISEQPVKRLPFHSDESLVEIHHQVEARFQPFGSQAERLTRPAPQPVTNHRPAQRAGCRQA
jgi:hypothetical protein